MNCVTAGNVMVQLFSQTQPKYHLNNKKLQYLLCIAQFVSLRCGRVLFDGNIRNLKNGFAVEKVADSFISHSAIQEGIAADKALKRSCEDFKIPFSAKKIYSISEELSDEDKRLLTSVFIRFGAYNEESLHKLLNGFTPLRNQPVWEDIPNEVVVDVLTDRVSHGGASLVNNEVFDFCNEYFEKEMKVEPSQPEPMVTPPVVEPVPIVIPEVVPEVVKPVRKDILKKYIHLSEKACTVGKEYVVYIESLPEKPVRDVIVATSNDDRIKGNLKQISDTLYCYSFNNVLDDIKIFVTCENLTDSHK